MVLFFSLWTQTFFPRFGLNTFIFLAVDSILLFSSLWTQYFCFPRCGLNKFIFLAVD